MFDARLRPLIDPPLNAIGRTIARAGISANQITVAGAVAGIGAGAAISAGAFGVGLALIVLSRLLDGLDGAVARATRMTDFGGYLDILADFLFYISVPLGFACAAPGNEAPAALLIASFTLTGVSFLAFAAIAGRRGLDTSAHGKKSFFYSTGIAEGAETIAVFVLMCLAPGWFGTIAVIYAGVCAATVVQRTMMAADLFKNGA